MNKEELVQEISKKANIPVRMTTVEESLFPALCNKIENLIIVIMFYQQLQSLMNV
mgnify:CR=1 FL=1